MALVEAKSNLESVQGDLSNHWIPEESRLLVNVEKNPLDYGSWRALVDVVEREGTHEKVVGLYEQCLIPCASYADIWMRYVDFLEEAEMLIDASMALSHAFLWRGRIDWRCVFFSAMYKERIGDISGAREHYYEIYSKISPGSLEALEALANMERRLACSAAEKQMGRTSGLPALLLRYASFAFLALEDTHKAKQVLIELDGLNLTRPVIKEVIDLASMFPRKEDTVLQEFLDSLVENYNLCAVNDGNGMVYQQSRRERREFPPYIWRVGDIRSINVAVRRHISLFRDGPFLCKKRA